MARTIEWINPEGRYERCFSRLLASPAGRRATNSSDPVFARWFAWWERQSWEPVRVDDEESLALAAVRRLQGYGPGADYPG